MRNSGSGVNKVFRYPATLHFFRHLTHRTILKCLDKFYLNTVHLSLYHCPFSKLNNFFKLELTYNKAKFVLCAPKIKVCTIIWKKFLTQQTQSYLLSSTIKSNFAKGGTSTKANIFLSQSLNSI